MQENFLKIFLTLIFGIFPTAKTLFCADPKAAHPLFYNGQFDEAASLYLQCTEDPESLFYASVCFEKLGNKERAHHIREEIYRNFSFSPFAEEALFFNLLESIDRNLDLLKESPYLAYFLILKGGHEHLNRALSLLDKPKSPYFLELKHRALLDLAKLEYEQNEDPIHIEYGLALLRQSTREESPPQIEQERDYLFAQFFAKNSKKQALKWIDKSIKKYEKENIVKNPYLFKLFKLKGRLLESLEPLELAENAFLPNQLPDEELLDLWLLKTHYFLRHRLEDLALNQLAAIINSPVASIKRIEAMALRQEVFTTMGRLDLASRHSATLNTLRKELNGCKTGSDF